MKPQDPELTFWRLSSQVAEGQELSHGCQQSLSEGLRFIQREELAQNADAENLVRSAEDYLERREVRRFV